MATRHAVALAEHGLDVTLLPEPPDMEGAERAKVRAVFEHDGALILTFAYDQALWQDVQALPERCYDRERKESALPATRESAEALVGLLHTHSGFTVDPDAALLLRALLAGEQPNAPVRYAQPDGQHAWRLVLPKPAGPRDFVLLAAVKAIPGARFFGGVDGTPAHWHIDTRQPGALDRLVMLLAQRPEIHLDDAARSALPHATIRVNADPATNAVAEQPERRWVKANTTTFTIDIADDPAVRGAVRAIPGAQRDRESKRWRVPRHALAAPALSALLAEHDLWASTDTRHALERLAAGERLRLTHAAKLGVLSRAHAIPEHVVASALDGFGVALHPFQRIPVVYPRLGVRNIWLADSLGLGKTVESLAVVYGERAMPCVVVCPKSLVLNWARREIPAAIPAARVAIARGKTPDPAILGPARLRVQLPARRRVRELGWVRDDRRGDGPAHRPQAPLQRQDDRR